MSNTLRLTRYSFLVSVSIQRYEDQRFVLTTGLLLVCNLPSTLVWYLYWGQLRLVGLGCICIRSRQLPFPTLSNPSPVPLHSMMTLNSQPSKIVSFFVTITRCLWVGFIRCCVVVLVTVGCVFVVVCVW